MLLDLSGDIQCDGNTKLFPIVVNRQIRHQATHKTGSQPGECAWSGERERQRAREGLNDENILVICAVSHSTAIQEKLGKLTVPERNNNKRYMM